MPVLPITIHRKHAVYTGAIPYVCSNSDYEVVFTFDAEWEAYAEKTARFCTGDQCVDRIFTGNTCPVPVFEAGDFLQIGVYAGNLQTSTAAMVRMCDSIRTAGGTPAEPEPAVYDQIMERLNSAATGKHISDYRYIMQPLENKYTLVLVYNDGTEMEIPLPQMGIDIDRIVKFGETDPTEETQGQTKQLYVNTATGKMWVCAHGGVVVGGYDWVAVSGGEENSAGVFIAEFNKTTFSDISEAYLRGEPVMARDGTTLYLLCALSSSTAIFFSGRGTKLYELRVTSDNEWEISNHSLQKTSDKVQTIDNTSTDTQYPSAKAVYNFVKDDKTEVIAWETIDTSSFMEVTHQFYDTSMQIYNVEWYSQGMLSVTPGEEYLLSSKANWTMARYILVDDNNTVYGADAPNNDYNYDNTRITVPDGATKLIIQSPSGGHGEYWVKLLKKRMAVPRCADDSLFGKKIVFLGDSICHDSTHYGKGWASRIGKRHKMQWNNNGKDGAVFTDGLLTSDGTGERISILGDLLPDVTANHSDADYIIFEGGTNDADGIGLAIGGSVPAKYGSISEGYDESELDPTTFCGAVELTFCRAIKQYKGKKIGYIVAPKMGNPYNDTVKNRRKYFDTVIECCRKWGVPYIDLWEGCVLNPCLTEMYDWNLGSGTENEYAGKMYLDAQHLTEAGYDYVSPIIEKWLMSL